jgi:hypothetical protein
VVASGTREVFITFEREYIEKPVVQATISFKNTTSTVTSTEGVVTTTDWSLLESRENAVFDQDIRYIVTRVSSTGFVIKLNKNAPFDIEFDWLALAVKNPKIFGVVTSTADMLNLILPELDTASVPESSTGSVINIDNSNADATSTPPTPDVMQTSSPVVVDLIEPTSTPAVVEEPVIVPIPVAPEEVAPPAEPAP